MYERYSSSYFILRSMFEVYPSYFFLYDTYDIYKYITSIIYKYYMHCVCNVKITSDEIKKMSYQKSYYLLRFVIVLRGNLDTKYNLINRAVILNSLRKLTLRRPIWNRFSVINLWLWLDKYLMALNVNFLMSHSRFDFFAMLGDFNAFPFFQR